MNLSNLYQERYHDYIKTELHTIFDRRVLPNDLLKQTLDDRLDQMNAVNQNGPRLANFGSY